MRGGMNNSHRWTVGIAVAVMIGIAAVPGAMAQGGRGGGGGGGGGFGQRGGMGGGMGGGMPGMGRGGFQRMLQPTFDTRELEILKDDLQLDDDQQSLLDAMYEGYQSAFADAMEAGQQRMQDMRDEMGPDGDWQAMAERFGKLAEEWAADRKELEDNFIGDLQSILTEDQMNRWPRYQRDQRRRQTLDQGASVPGESVDVIELVEVLELDDASSAKIEPMLDQYSADLDRALTARNEMSDQDANRMIGMMSRGFGNQPTDEEQQEIEDRMRKSQELHEAVRDTNQRYVNVVAGQLDPEAAAKLQDEYTRRSYPNVFRATPADRYIERVQGLDTLTAEQVELIDMISHNYTTRIEDLNRRLVDAERKMEKERVEQRFERMKQMREMWQEAQRNGGPPDPGQMRGMFGGPPDDNDPVIVLRNEKQELSNSTLEEVFRVLTPDQQAEAPKPEPDRGRQRWQQQMQQNGNGGQPDQQRGGRGQRGRGSDV